MVIRPMTFLRRIGIRLADWESLNDHVSRVVHIVLEADTRRHGKHGVSLPPQKPTLALPKSEYIGTGPKT